MGRIARREMLFERCETPVQVGEGVDATPNLRTMLGDEFAQLGGDEFTMTGRAEGRQLARPIEGKIERAEADQESKPLDIRRGVLPIAVRRPRGHGQ